jgi:hypothetical protein
MFFFVFHIFFAVGNDASFLLFCLEISHKNYRLRRPSRLVSSHRTTHSTVDYHDRRVERVHFVGLEGVPRDDAAPFIMHLHTRRTWGGGVRSEYSRFCFGTRAAAAGGERGRDNPRKNIAQTNAMRRPGLVLERTISLPNSSRKR